VPVSVIGLVDVTVSVACCRCRLPRSSVSLFLCWCRLPEAGLTYASYARSDPVICRDGAHCACMPVPLLMLCLCCSCASVRSPMPFACASASAAVAISRCLLPLYLCLRMDLQYPGALCLSLYPCPASIASPVRLCRCCVGACAGYDSDNRSLAGAGAAMYVLLMRVLCRCLCCRCLACASAVPAVPVPVPVPLCP
jgi:hypothetical protein